MDRFGGYEVCKRQKRCRHFERSEEFVVIHGPPQAEAKANADSSHSFGMTLARDETRADWKA